MGKVNKIKRYSIDIASIQGMSSSREDCETNRKDEK